MAQPGSYLVALADLVETHVSKLIIDPQVHLYGLKLYQQRCDNACSRYYPFFLIELGDCNKLVRYDVYKYIARLPYYGAIRQHRKLPIIDHINRMPNDCSMSNRSPGTRVRGAELDFTAMWHTVVTRLRVFRCLFVLSIP